MRRVSMPRDAVHGTVVHKTKYKETINKQREVQTKKRPCKPHADTKMFPIIIIALKKDTKLLKLTVKER